jgi:drug/metabolite transporter (DMT)-like permease
VLAGVTGAIGITCLYRGLSVGRMGIVAPVTGVVAATIPVLVGSMLQGLPNDTALIGVALALVAVVLVSRVADEGGGRAGLGLGLAAGVGFGLFNVTIAQVTPGLVFGPLSIVRGVEAILILAIILGTRSAWRPPVGLLPVIALVGVLDMAGNATYILAAQSGLISIASTLSSLYPVTTVILAAIFLRERVTRDHAAGITLAGIAIVLIAYGSTQPTP